MSSPSIDSFEQLNLPKPVLEGLKRLGYETPSPIQAECIPLLLEGKDIIGQAQTGTGKTAAFALPLLSNVDLSNKNPQILVLAPTRELAIQVSEAFQSYAAQIKGFHVLPIYGGQSYDIQLRQLKRGVHVIVGTPGRVMDHLTRKTLKLDQLQALVLDEADEMLRMGFIDDVEWILDKTPSHRQIALFSATMPSAIQKVATKYLKNPELVKIKTKTQTAITITQSYLQVNNHNKLDALTRILESTDFDAVLIFVRTKTATVDLTEKLEARGYATDALNGDIPQKLRERTIDKIKAGKIDIIVATDVAARGLDVSRISLVINYDIPHDSESYVHRIGRTGRAGKQGQAILFVTQKERHLLRSIERLAQHKIEPLHLPSTEDINLRRVEKFKQRIQATLETAKLDTYYELVESFAQESDSDPLQIAAALVKMVQGKEPLLVQDRPEKKGRQRKEERSFEDDDRSFGGDRGDRANRPSKDRSKDRVAKEINYQAKPLKEFPDIQMKRYRLDVGYQHDVKPGNIVGAIANEGDIDSCYIGNIDIHDNFSLVDLPDGMPSELFKILRKTRVAGQALDIKAFSEDASESKGRKKSEPTADGEDKPSRPTIKRSSKPKHGKRKGKRPAVAARKNKNQPS